MNSDEKNWCDDFIFIKTKSFIDKIPVKDVIFVQRSSRKLIVVTDDMKYEYYEKMERIENLFGSDFLKCHSGCIVNLKKIKQFKDQRIELDNGNSISLGKNKYIKAKQAYCAYIHKWLTQ